MIGFIKRYYAFLIGLIITLSGFFTVVNFELVDFPEDAVVAKLVVFIFWWVFTSLFIHNFRSFVRNKILILKIVALSVLLAIAEFADFSLNIPANPISFPLITIFWLGVFYLLATKFFLKYWVPIILLYGSIILYFFYARLTTDYWHFDDDTIIGLLIVPIPLLMILWLYEQWRRLKTLKAEKGEAELALLKSQISPHFLFNTLNNLYGLAVEKSDDAPEVVLKLSDMLRYTIYEGKEEFVTLKQEVDYLENYIQLHKIRYQKNVSIIFNHKIDADAKITPLLFIILLENAFKHGVEHLTDEAYIKMDLIVADGNIIFQIENNFDPQGTNSQKGIGLENLKHRLQLIYPKTHKLIINESGDVFHVTLEIQMV